MEYNRRKNTKPVEKREIQKLLLEKGKKIIIFDGECNLCDFVISFLQKRNKYEHLAFLSFQILVFANFISANLTNRKKPHLITSQFPKI